MPKRTKSRMCMWYIIMINVLIAVQYFLLLGRFWRENNMISFLLEEFDMEIFVEGIGGIN